MSEILHHQSNSSILLLVGRIPPGPHFNIGKHLGRRSWCRMWVCRGARLQSPAPNILRCGGRGPGGSASRKSWCRIADINSVKVDLLSQVKQKTEPMSWCVWCVCLCVRVFCVRPVCMRCGRVCCVLCMSLCICFVVTRSGRSQVSVRSHSGLQSGLAKTAVSGNLQ